MNGRTDEAFVKERLKPRPRDMHKGHCGRVLIAAGSLGMTGAAVLGARAALRSGAGLVTAAVPAYLFYILQTAVPEATCIDTDTLTETNLNIYDAIAAGPGTGQSPEQYRILEHILLTFRGPVIIDADGINNLCRFGQAPELNSGEVPAGRRTSILPDIIAKREHPVIMTPHPGEADRLLESLGEDSIEALGREKAAEILAADTGAIIVLKGSETLVAVPEKKDEKVIINTYVNCSGNPGMATGGSGDVLTGCLAALTAFGRNCRRAGMEEISTEDAVRTAVYMHGYAGDLAAARLGETGMTSMDIAQALPEAFKNIIGR